MLGRPFPPWPEGATSPYVHGGSRLASSHLMAPPILESSPNLESPGAHWGTITHGTMGRILGAQGVSFFPSTLWAQMEATPPLCNSGLQGDPNFQPEDATTICNNHMVNVDVF